MGPSRQSNRGHLLQTALRMLTYLWKEFFKTQLESAQRPCSFVSYEFRSAEYYSLNCSFYFHVQASFLSNSFLHPISISFSCLMH